MFQKRCNESINRGNQEDATRHMRVLILSGTSNVGTALVPHIASFADVVTAGRGNCDHHIDLLDTPDQISFPQNVDALVITAAAFAGKTMEDMLNTASINVLGTIKLCAAAAKSGIRHIILVSTALVTVHSLTATYSAYSVSKKHSEDVARLCCAMEKISLTILRPSRIYGDSDSFRKHQPFLYSLADRAESNQSIEIFGTHDAKRNFIHVEDLCRIIGKVIQQKVIGIFSCVNPVNVSISQIAHAAHQSFASDSYVVFLNDRPDISDDDFQQDGVLYQEISCSPQICIEDGLARIAEYRRSQKSAS